MSLFGGAPERPPPESAQKAIDNTPATATKPTKIEKRSIVPKIQVLDMYITSKTDLSILVQGTTRFHVSRMHMCLASPVWNAMLDPNGRFLENKKGEDVSFKDDAVEPFQLVLDIIHINFGKFPSRISSSQLYELAQFSDKYDVAHSVQPFLAKWINEQPDFLHGLSSAKQLWVIWVFGHKELDPDLQHFSSSFNAFVKKAKSEGCDKAEKTLDMGPLPPGLENISAILKKGEWEQGEREEHNRAKVLALVTERLKLLLKEETCQSVDTGYRQRCNTLLISEVFKKLNSMFGFNIFARNPEHWLVGKSLADIVKRLDTLKYVDRIHHNAHAKCNDWVERLLKDINTIAGGPTGDEIRLREELLAKLKARAVL